MKDIEEVVDVVVDEAREEGIEETTTEEVAVVEEAVEEVTEETVAEVAEVPEAVAETTEIEDETTEVEDEAIETVGMEEIVEEEKKKSPWKALVALVLVAVLGFLGYSYLGQGTETNPILYAKDGGLYVADGIEETYLLHEDLGEESGYHYLYGAWGALASKEGTMGYYLADVDAIGMGTLYMQDLANPQGEVAIAEDVLAIAVSDDGEVCLYLTLENESSVSVFVVQDGESRLLTDKLLMQTTAYALSQDGTYAMFQEDDGTTVTLCVYNVATGERTTVADAPVMYVLAEDGIGYYINKENDTNVLYTYAVETGATKIAEDVYFFDVMGDGNSVLYGTLPAEDITYADLILDDVVDLSGFDVERQAQIASIREQMATAEGIEPVLQNPYIWKDGVTIAVDKDVISLVPITGEGNFFFGYAVPEFEKMPLSEIYSLEEAVMMYYTDLNYGAKEMFVANDAGDVYTIETGDALPSTIMISGDGATIAYLLATETGNRLMVETLGVADSVKEVAVDVQIFGFVGENHNLVYYNNYINGLGDISVYVDGISTLVDSNALSVTYWEDEESIIYIANPDDTGNGELKELNGETAAVIAENVFVFQSRDENSTVYMQGYDIESGLGDIYHYLDGESIFIADDATAIYMY